MVHYKFSLFYRSRNCRVQLEQTSVAKAPYCHVVVIVSTFLHGSTSQRVSALLSDLQPLECHVYCSQSEEMHAELLPVTTSHSAPGQETSLQEHGLEGYSHFGEFQALMRKWISRDVGVRVSVQHLPLFHAEVSPGLLTTPIYSSLFPLLPNNTVDIQARLLSEGETDISLESLKQVDFGMLPRTLQLTLKSFASSLHSLLEMWGMSEDIFSLGFTSRFIANQLALLPAARARRKLMTSRCSVLLVDRSLDVTGPSLHPTDSLADRILSLLPHSSPSSCDVSIDMSELGVLSGGESHDRHVTSGLPGISGRLGHPSHPRARQLLKTLICSKQKEALMEVSRCLLESASEEGVPLKLSGRMGRPSAAQLKTFIQQFKDCPKACASQHAVLELACAVVQALQGDIDQKWEGLASMEKVLSLSLQDQDSPSIATQLADQAHRLAAMATKGTDDQERITTPVTLAELLGVAVAMYSWVTGEGGAVSTPEEEEGLKEALADLAVTRRSCDMEFLQLMGIGRSDSRSKVLGRMGTVMDTLVGLGEARDQLSQFRHTLGIKDGSYLPLLLQLIRAIFDPAQPELTDVVAHHSQGTVGSILKSSLSLFVSSTKPRPNQHPLLLVFVVGGTSCSEVRQIRELLNSLKTNTEVVIGTTRLTTPSNVTTQILCSS